jgi:hypothetical protein
MNINESNMLDIKLIELSERYPEDQTNCIVVTQHKGGRIKLQPAFYCWGEWIGGNGIKIKSPVRAWIDISYEEIIKFINNDSFSEKHESSSFKGLQTCRRCVGKFSNDNIDYIDGDPYCSHCFNNTPHTEEGFVL